MMTMMTKMRKRKQVAAMASQWKRWRSTPQRLNVTSFLSQHPGGELAILTFAGKDATEEFNMIHPPDVIPKYAPDAIIGAIGSGPAVSAAPARSGGGGGRQLEK